MATGESAEFVIPRGTGKVGKDVIPSGWGQVQLADNSKMPYCAR